MLQRHCTKIRTCWTAPIPASWSTPEATNPRRCGCRHLVGWGSIRALSGEPPQRRLYAGRSRCCFGHAPPLRSCRRPHYSGRKSRLSKFTSRRPKATFGCHRTSRPRRRRIRNRSSRVRRPSPSRPVNGEPIVDGKEEFTIPRDELTLLVRVKPLRGIPSYVRAMRCRKLPVSGRCDMNCRKRTAFGA